MSPPPRTDGAPAPTSGEAPTEGGPRQVAARRLHRALLEALLSTSKVPSRKALAAGRGLEPDGVKAALHELAAADYAVVDETGRLTCLYPLSPTPTPHVAVVDGERRHAMYAIDLLGIPAMRGRELALEEALGHAGALFGDLLRASALPASGRCGRASDQPRGG